MLSAAPYYFALGAEQGTGKTWMLLQNAEEQHAQGKIEALVVIAPKGVHLNWTMREIPKHMSTKTKCDYWLSGMGVRHKRRLTAFVDKQANAEGELMVLAVNYDAVNTPSGLKYVRCFMRRYRSMLVLDESHHIKNPDSKRTKKITDILGELAVSKRIASGTLIADKPLDLFGQYQFLKNGILGTTSYRSFMGMYADLLPPSSGIVRDIAKKTFRHQLKGLTGSDLERKLTVLMKNTKHGGAPVIARDSMGRPKYRNLDKLGRVIAPHTFRVLKKDCLDLPDKIYKTHIYDLSSKQRKLYDKVHEEMRYLRDDGDLDIYSALTLTNKLRQLSSGFIMVEGDVEPTELTEEAEPRLKALQAVVEDAGDSPMIVWASFRYEIEEIVKHLEPYGEVCVYHGQTPTAARNDAVDGFQEGRYRFFVATPGAGGTGLTLTAAEQVVYYSCSYALVERTQSEDRSHRIGTTKNVVYTDIVARGTIDERIAYILQGKERDASTVMDAVQDFHIEQAAA
jgi:SNF2 family DNA or RNA helicase